MISRMRSVRILTMLVPLVLLVVLLMVPLLVVLAMLAIVLLLILLMMLIITFIVHRRLKGWFFKNNIFVGCVSYRAYTGQHQAPIRCTGTGSSNCLHFMKDWQSK